MKTRIKVIIRKSNHYNFSGDERYDVREEMIEGETEQEILDKFYLKNRRCDMSFYHEFADKEWKEKLDRWYKSDDYAKRSFQLFYHNSIVD